jgi:hypothetical protein
MLGSQCSSKGTRVPTYTKKSHRRSLCKCDGRRYKYREYVFIGLFEHTVHNDPLERSLKAPTTRTFQEQSVDHPNVSAFNFIPNPVSLLILIVASKNERYWRRS